MDQKSPEDPFRQILKGGAFQGKMMDQHNEETELSSHGKKFDWINPAIFGLNFPCLFIHAEKDIDDVRFPGRPERQ